MSCRRSTTSPHARRAPPARAARSGAGEIFFKAVGHAGERALRRPRRSRPPGLFFAYDGRIELPADGAHTFDGDVRVSSREFGDVMAIAGLGTGGALRGVPIVGTVKMISANHAIELKPQQLTVGGSKVDGTPGARLSRGRPGHRHGAASGRQGDDPRPLGRCARSQQPPAAVSRREPLDRRANRSGPSSPSTLPALDGIEGKLGVNFGTLVARARHGHQASAARGDAGARQDRGHASSKASALGGSVVGGAGAGAGARRRQPGRRRSPHRSASSQRGRRR